MTVQFTAANWKLPLGLLLAACLLLPSEALTQTRSPRAPAWKLKDSKASLHIQASDLVVSANSTELRRIPVPSITLILYDTQAYHPVPGMMERWVKWQLDTSESQGDNHTLNGWAAIFGVAAMTPFLPVKSKRHFVNLSWGLQSAPQSASFQLSKKDALSLAETLSRLSGKPWQNLHQERENSKKRKRKPQEPQKRPQDDGSRPGPRRSPDVELEKR